MEGAVSKVKDFLQKGTRVHSIFAANPEKNFSVPKDPELYESFRAADLILPDGIGVVLAAKILHGARLQRVTGIELMQNICELAAREGHRVFFFGASERVNEEAARILQKRYPELAIVGRANGYLKDGEMPDLIGHINDSQAEILFVALGSPKQEKWFATYKNFLTHVKVCQGIGGTLDVIAGSVKRAPEIWQKYSIEWLYRSLSQPKRIVRQKALVVFAVRVLISKLNSLHLSL